MTEFAPTVPGASAPLSPAAPRAHPPLMTAFELDQLRDQWRQLQDEIDEALNARDLNRACVLSGECRRLDRLIFSQPSRIGARR